MNLKWLEFLDFDRNVFLYRQAHYEFGGRWGWFGLFKIFEWCNSFSFLKFGYIYNKSYKMSLLLLKSGKGSNKLRLDHGNLILW